MKDMQQFKAERNSAGNVYIYERVDFLWRCVALNQYPQPVRWWAA